MYIKFDFFILERPGRIWEIQEQRPSPVRRQEAPVHLALGQVQGKGPPGRPGSAPGVPDSPTESGHSHIQVRQRTFESLFLSIFKFLLSIYNCMRIY